MVGAFLERQYLGSGNVVTVSLFSILFFFPNGNEMLPVCDHSRREGDIRSRDDEDPVGSDQSGRVTGHHSQAEQELPRRGTTSAPNTDCLNGQQGQKCTQFIAESYFLLPNVRCTSLITRWASEHADKMHEEDFFFFIV